MQHKPSFGELRTASMYFSASSSGSPYISDGDSARVLFFFNLSGAYNGKARLDEAKQDASIIVHRVNHYPQMLATLQMLQAYLGNPTHKADVPVFEQLDACLAAALGLPAPEPVTAE